MSDAPKVNFKPITPTELAAEIGIDPKTLRRIMRSMTDRDSQPGSGARWEINSQAAVDAIKERVSRTHNRKTVSFAPKA